MRDISQGEKTQKATPKKRKDERKKGNIFQSRDLSGALSLLGLFLFLLLTARYFFGLLAVILKGYFGEISQTETLTVLTARSFLTGFAVKSMLLSLPILILAALLSAALLGAQTRINFTLSRLKPDWKRINPIEGIKKLITVRSLTELVKSAVKIAIVSVVVYTEIKGNLPEIIRLMDKSLPDALAFIGRAALIIALKSGLYMLAFGVLDYFYQWWEYERQIRMSFQEIRDEYKETEGDPQIRSQRKERQRRMSMLRIAQKVPHADVVIRNPTHFAVAIKYDPEKDNAPKVLAKGQDYLALKIVEIAQKHHIPVTANPPLARGLYESAEMDREIPEKYYQAVAEVLVFVYTKLRN